MVTGIAACPDSLTDQLLEYRIDVVLGHEMTP
jgi:hypothetical protein